MSNEDLRTILNTFNRHFEHVSVWRPQTGDLVLVGSDVEHQLDWTEVNALVNADDDASELQRLGMDEARDLVYSFIFANPELENYAHASRTNRDEHPVVEFNAPRYLYAETVETNLTDIFQFLNTRKVTVPITGMHEVTAASIDARAMNLEIAIPGEREAEAIQSTWVIGRFLLLENEQNVYGIGSHRNLSWREGPSTFHVQASWHEQAHEHQQLMALLGQLQESEIERGGEINLREGNNGSWLMSPSQTPGMTDFGLGWLCPSRTGGFTRYFVRAQVPAASDWGQDLVEIAGRFSCYP